MVAVSVLLYLPATGQHIFTGPIDCPNSGGKNYTIDDDEEDDEEDDDSDDSVSIWYVLLFTQLQLSSAQITWSGYILWCTWCVCVCVRLSIDQNKLAKN